MQYSDFLLHFNLFTPFITSDNAGDKLKEYPAIAVDNNYSVPARSAVTLIGHIEKETSVGERENHQPKTATLLKGYPNPFNNTIQKMGKNSRKLRVKLDYGKF